MPIEMALCSVDSNVVSACCGNTLPLPSLHAAKRIIAELYAVQSHDSIAERGKGAADLAVAAFAHDDLPVEAAIVEAL